MVPLFILYISFLITICLFSYKYYKSQISYPPGPFGLPFIGYLPFLGEKPHLKFTHYLSPKYGNVFSFKFGTKLTIVLNDWECVKEAYITNGNIFAGRSDLFLFRLLNKGHGLLHSEGKYRKNQKKFLTTAMKDILSNKAFNIVMMKEVKHLCNAVSLMHNQDFDPHGLIQGCFFNIVSLLVFGLRYEYDEKKITDFLGLICQNFKLIGKKVAPLNFLPFILRENSVIKKFFDYDELYLNINGISKFSIECIRGRLEERKNTLCGGDGDICFRPQNIVDIYLDKMLSYSALKNLNEQSIQFTVPEQPIKVIENLIEKGRLAELITGDELPIKNDITFTKYNDFQTSDLQSSTKCRNLIEEHDFQMRNPFNRESTADEKGKNVRCQENQDNNNLFDKSFENFLMSGDVKEGFSGLDLIISVMDVFLGGTETTQTVMRWGLYFMAKYPDIQCQVYSELKRFVDSNKRKGYDKDGEDSFEDMITYNDRDNLPFTMATVLEIQRRACIAPLGFFHSNTKEINSFTGRYLIPERSLIIANHWALHHDPKYWPEPYVFNPERFLLNENDELNEPRNNNGIAYHRGKSDACPILDVSLNKDPLLPDTNKYITDNECEEDCNKKFRVVYDKPSYIPFSIGPRSCFGSNLAKNEIFTVFANLLLNFRLSFPEGDDNNSPKIKVEEDTIDDGTLSLTWSPLPYKITAVARN
ncbi:unnamed protein product [Gordionus sp. m RMFG-2023]